jgi:4-hydroxybenzoate polyprenyltransferase
MNPDPRPASFLVDLMRTLRPSQWTKNLVVLAAVFFAFGDKTQSVSAWAFGAVAVAALLFCIVSGGVYVLNDIRDAAQDRLHPIKRLRPIASGSLSISAAWPLAIVLLAFGMAGAVALSLRLAFILALYVVIQIAYTLWLKHIALIDIFVIAVGFVLRALAGGVVVGVTISPWLLLCTFLLALFLALCKRRHEKISLEGEAESHRAALEHYDRRLLDQLIAIVSGAAIVSYSIYTLWPETVHKFGTTHMVFTVPFVMFGIFRYLDLVYRHEEGGRPERILLTDVPLLVDLVLYALCVLIVFYCGR